MATSETILERPAAPPHSVGFRPYRITVDVYERIAASGALGDRSGVILWNGQLVQKVADMTKGRRHVFSLSRLARIMPGFIPAGYFVEQDQPVELGREYVPEPDLKVVRGADTDFQRRNPEGRDVPLVVEVADSSLVDDTGELLRAYAAAAIPVYWVVNIPDKRIDVYTDPTGPSQNPTYTAQRQFQPGDAVPVVLDGREVGRVAVNDVLP